MEPGTAVGFDVTVTDGQATTVATIAISIVQPAGAAANSAPVFDSAGGTFELNFDAASGTIGTLSATDAEGDALVFSGFDFTAGLVEITPDGSVVVDADRFGNVEPGQAIEITAYASDGIHEVSMPVTVNITASQEELDNSAPTFSSQQFSFDVPQSVGQGLIVGHVDATDVEQHDLTFSIAEGESAPTFGVDTFGNVYVASPAALSGASLGDTFNFQVSVADRYSSSISNVAINVVEGDGDSNSSELPIVFKQGSYGFGLPIDVTRGAVLGTIEAIDDNGGDISYGGANEFASVDSAGNILLHDPIRLKEQEVSSTVPLTVTATNGSVVAATDVFLTILPEGNLKLNREFESATNELVIETDYDALIERLPFINRVELFASALTEFIDESEQSSSNASSSYDDDAWSFGTPEDGAGRPSAYEFLPDALQYSEFTVPLSEASDPTTIALNGTDSYSNMSTISVERSQEDAIVTEALPGLTSTATVTQHHSQDFVSDSEFVVTQSVSTTYQDQVASGSSTAGDNSGTDDVGKEEEDFKRTVTETLTVTVEDGLTTTYSYSISTSVGYTVGDLPGVTDQDPDDPLQIPEGWSSAVDDANKETADGFDDEENGDSDGDSGGESGSDFWGSLFGGGGNNSSGGSEGGDGEGGGSEGGDGESGDDGPVTESSSGFGAAFEASTTITVTLVESKVIMPDGSTATSYDLSFGNTVGATSIACGFSGFSSSEGELEGENGDGDSESGDGENGNSNGDGSDGDGGLGGGDGTDGGGPGGPGGGSGDGSDGSGGGDGSDGGGPGGGDGSDGGGSDGEGSNDDLPPELNTSDIEGTGDGHSISANSQFMEFSSSNAGMNFGIGLTIPDGQSQSSHAPSISFGTNFDTQNGGMEGASISADIQEPTEDGFRYVSFSAAGDGGGNSDFGFEHSFSKDPVADESSASLGISANNSGFGNDSGSTNVINQRKYEDASGNKFFELRVISSGGDTSEISEHGFDEGEITDTALAKSGGATHLLSVHNSRWYTQTDTGPVLTMTSDEQSQLSSTHDFSASLDESGEPLNVLLGLVSEPSGGGDNEIKYKSTSHQVTDNLPHLPLFMVDSYRETKIDAVITANLGKGGVSGGVTGTKTTIVKQTVEGIFTSGQTSDGSGWEGQTPKSIDDEFDEVIDETLELPQRSKEEILADLTDALENKLNIEAIMAYDPVVGARLTSRLEELTDSIAELEAEASEKGATAEEIAGAHNAAAAAAADFDPAEYVKRTELIKKLGQENADLKEWENFLGNFEMGMHVIVMAGELAGGITVVAAGGGPVLVIGGLLATARGMDHAITATLEFVDGVDRDTFLNQGIVGLTGSEAAGDYGEATFDVALLIFNLKQLLKKPKAKSSNCFVAGTQVVTGHKDQKPDTAITRAAAASEAIALDHSPNEKESLDHLFAAGAFTLMAGLSVQRKRSKSKRDARRLRPA